MHARSSETESSIGKQSLDRVGCCSGYPLSRGGNKLHNPKIIAAKEKNLCTGEDHHLTPGFVVTNSRLAPFV